MIFMFLSYNPSSGDINSSNLSCYIMDYPNSCIILHRRFYQLRNVHEELSFKVKYLMQWPLSLFFHLRTAMA